MDPNWHFLKYNWEAEQNKDTVRKETVHPIVCSFVKLGKDKKN